MLQISMMTLYHYCSHRDDPLLLFNSNVTGVFNMMTLHQLFFLSGVENVINFDCPPNSNTYIHRVGRYVWTFVCRKESVIIIIIQNGSWL